MAPRDAEPLSQFSSPRLDDANAAIALDDPLSGLTLLRMAATEAPEPAATELRLEAAVLALAIGDLDAANRAVAQMDARGSARVQALKTLLRIALDRANPDRAKVRALTDLEGLLSKRTEPWRLRWLSDMQLALGQNAAAFASERKATRLTLPLSLRLLSDAHSWTALSRQPVSALREQQTQATDAEIRDWLELAVGVLDNALDRSATMRHLERWLDAGTPSAPRRLLADRLLAIQGAQLSPTRRIAVLLPFSGELTSAAEAIRQGMLAAYYRATPSARPHRLEFIDIGPDGQNVIRAYREAVDNGAGMVVGPLTKSNVANLVTNTSIDVPTLALNRIDDTPVDKPLFYQFSLAPEDDAEAIAALASALGYRQAVVFAAANDWGARVGRAFAVSFETHDGEVIEQGRYPLDQEDLGAPIRALLNLDRSEARYERLRRITGSRFIFEERRRQDIDMVFMAAFDDSARLIVPQLRFHRGIDLPVLGTDQSYPASEQDIVNADLSGTLITRMPWLLDNGSMPSITNIKASLLEVYPDRRQERLVAFGVDTYQLLGTYQALDANQALELPGATGQLNIDAENRIQRRLPAMRITNRGLTPIALPPRADSDGYWP